MPVTFTQHASYEFHFPYYGEYENGPKIYSNIYEDERERVLNHASRHGSQKKKKEKEKKTKGQDKMQ